MEVSIKQKFETAIKNFNENQFNLNDRVAEEKLESFISKIIDKVKGSNDNSIKDFLINCFDFKKEFFVKLGDNLLERFWTLYDMTITTKELNRPKVTDLKFPIEKDDLFKSLVSLFLVDTSDINTIVTFDQTKINFTSDTSLIKSFILKNNLNRNEILDLIVVMTFSLIDLQAFYTSLSTFIVQTFNSSLLLFKTITLFSICILVIEKKENHVDSLLFITGSVLRDHARSYLKTKNKYNESLSYHVCKVNNHTKKDHQFNEPIILTSLECDFLEQNFLSILLGLFYCVNDGLKLKPEEKNNKIEGGKWEYGKDIFYKYLNSDDLDVEEKLDGNISVRHYLMLFLSDFVFYFVSNFCDFLLETGSKNFYLEFTSRFSEFDVFLNFCLFFFKSSCGNFVNLFDYSIIKKRFLEIDCQRTNYSLKDKFNHYGISLLIYLFIIERCTDLVPFITSYDTIINIIYDSVASILNFERSKKEGTSISYIADFDQILLKVLIKTDGFCTYQENIFVLKEIFLAKYKKVEVFQKILEIIKKDVKEEFLKKLLLAETNNLEFCKICEFLLQNKFILSFNQTDVDDLFQHTINSEIAVNSNCLLLLISLLGTNKSKISIKKCIENFNKLNRKEEETSDLQKDKNLDKIRENLEKIMI